jgi:hypothetical protein
LIQTFPTGSLRQNAAKVIVQQRYRPPIHLLNDGSYCLKPLSDIGTIYIIHLCAMQGAVHLPPQTPQPDSSLWYVSNTIDMNAFNGFHM